MGITSSWISEHNALPPDWIDCAGIQSIPGH